MTYLDFVNAICSRLETGWNAYAPAIVGTVEPPFIQFPNTNVPAFIVTERCRCRLYYVVNKERQATLAPAGSRRFDANGTFYVQIYAPAGIPESKSRLIGLCMMVKDLYSGVSEPAGAWYRDVTIVDQAPTANWFSARVGGTFTYSRIG